MDLTSDGKNMFVQPYKELKKAQTIRKESNLERGGMRGGDGHSHSGAAAAVGAAGKGLGKMSGGLAKGMLLDLPVAMADGFHAMPMLYGDKKMERGAVNDWKSGMTVGGKVRFIFEEMMAIMRMRVADCEPEGSCCWLL
jgi:hypothetical protein